MLQYFVFKCVYQMQCIFKDWPPDNNDHCFWVPRVVVVHRFDCTHNRIWKTTWKTRATSYSFFQLGCTLKKAFYNLVQPNFVLQTHYLVCFCTRGQVCNITSKNRKSIFFNFICLNFAIAIVIGTSVKLSLRPEHLWGVIVVKKN